MKYELVNKNRKNEILELIDNYHKYRTLLGEDDDYQSFRLYMSDHDYKGSIQLPLLDYISALDGLCYLLDLNSYFLPIHSYSGKYSRFNCFYAHLFLFSDCDPYNQKEMLVYRGSFFYEETKNNLLNDDNYPEVNEEDQVEEEGKEQEHLILNQKIKTKDFLAWAAEKGFIQEVIDDDQDITINTPKRRDQTIKQQKLITEIAKDVMLKHPATKKEFLSEDVAKILLERHKIELKPAAILREYLKKHPNY